MALWPCGLAAAPWRCTLVVVVVAVVVAIFVAVVVALVVAFLLPCSGSSFFSFSGVFFFFVIFSFDGFFWGLFFGFFDGFFLGFFSGFFFDFFFVPFFFPGGSSSGLLVSDTTRPASHQRSCTKKTKTN